MGQDVSRIEGVYDSIAREYAEAFSGEHGKKPMDQVMLHRFAREMKGRSPVWDFGCGPGHTARYLADLGVDISGLDLSARMLEQAANAHPGIPFRKGDVLNLKFADSSIAGLVSFYAIVHFSPEQVRRAVREMFRVLRPGGMLLLAFHIGEDTLALNEFLGRKISIDFMFFSPEFVQDCLARAGFQGIAVVQREPYPDVEYPSRRAYVWARKPDE